MNEPGGLCFNPQENCIYVADTNNHCIRRIDLSSNYVETVRFLDFIPKTALMTQANLRFKWI